MREHWKTAFVAVIIHLYGIVISVWTLLKVTHALRYLHLIMIPDLYQTSPFRWTVVRLLICLSLQIHNCITNYHISAVWKCNGSVSMRNLISALFGCRWLLLPILCIFYSRLLILLGLLNGGNFELRNLIRHRVRGRKYYLWLIPIFLNLCISLIKEDSRS